MRLGVVATAICLSLASLASADEAKALARKVTQIPAEPLAPALTALATEFDLQVLYRSEMVERARTGGASGVLSPDEAFERILSGTGLTYRYLDERTVTVMPTSARVPHAAGIVPPKAAQANDSAAQAAKEGKTSSSRGFRMAQLGQAGAAANTAIAAQDGPVSVARAQLEEVIVTAEKRTERLQDVPLTVSAISGGDLSGLQITQSAGLVGAVPALTFQQGTNPQNASFRIRGIGTSLFGVGTVSSVAVVLDGVPMARQAQSFFNLADIERIEVLEGPQGTLFGEGASAGVINVITKAPSKRFEGSVDSTVAQDGEYTVDGTLSGPLGETTAARLTGYYSGLRGIMQEVGVDSYENGANDWGTRGKFQWNPTQDLRLLFTASYGRSNDNCCAAVLIESQSPAMIKLNSGVSISPTNRNVVDDGMTFSNTTQQLYSMQADLDLGSATLTSISGYQRYDLDNNSEQDAIRNPAPVYVGGKSGAAFSQFNINAGVFGLKQADEELRITDNGNERLNYVAGIYLQDLTIDRGFTRRRAYCAAGTFAQIGTPCIPTSYQSYAVAAKVRSDVAAAFGQLQYRLIGGLKAIAGLRVQYEDVSASGRPAGLNGTGLMVAGDQPYGSAVTGKRSTTDTSLSGKAGLQYEFNRNAQAYATYTRGFKGAGFNASPITNYAAQNPVLPEYVNAYEVGFKVGFWQGRWTVDTSAFIEDYSNLQVQIAIQDPIAGTLSATQTNAGTSSSKGVEIESTLRPIGGLSLNAALMYVKTSINLNGLGCPLELSAAAVPLAGTPPVNECYVQQGQALLNVRGGQLPASPEWRADFTPRYAHGIGERLVGFAQVNVNYQSSEGFDLNQDPLLRQKAYTLVDFSIGMTTSDDRYGLTLFAKNVFDKNYYTSLAHSLLLATAANPYDIYANIDKNSRRYFGFTVRARF
jgi:iron complex outermembrane recepter protein